MHFEIPPNVLLWVDIYLVTALYIMKSIWASNNESGYDDIFNMLRLESRILSSMKFSEERYELPFIKVVNL